MSTDSVTKAVESRIYSTIMIIATVFSILFCILGAVEMIYSGFWLGSLAESKRLVASSKPSTKKTIENDAIELGFDHMEQLALLIGMIAGLQFGMSFAVCCGSCCEFRTVVKALVLLVIFLAVMNLAALVMGYIFFHSISQKNIVRVLKKNLIEKYTLCRQTTEDKAIFTYLMDRYQVTQGCCGAGNYTDYFYVPGWLKSRTRGNQFVPIGCCKLNVYDFLYEKKLTLLAGSCIEKPTAENSNAGRACGEVMVNELKLYLLQGCLITQIVGVVLSERRDTLDYNYSVRRLTLTKIGVADTVASDRHRTESKMIDAETVLLGRRRMKSTTV